MTSINGFCAQNVARAASAWSLASARQAVRTRAELREQRVAEIQRRVQAGTYDVPSRVLARKLLDR